MQRRRCGTDRRNGHNDIAPYNVCFDGDGIPLAAAAGDRGMANLLAIGEPERSRASLADLVRRIRTIDRLLD